MNNKKFMAFLLAAMIAATNLAACSSEKSNSDSTQNSNENTTAQTQETIPQTSTETPKDTASNETAPSETAKTFEGTSIELSDNGITVNGEAVSSDENSDVYVKNDIVFYEQGKDFTYGEGSENDAHSQEEADKHSVVHITKPGDYLISGSLSAGQIAVDLGEDAETDPNAVVNLYLDGADITCTVAPAVIFYNVYECGSDDAEKASKDVDTSAAGANVYIVDGSENNINGSYVAKIYKSVELSEDGKTVLDSKKLHKYDAAFYSKKSMNIFGDSGILNINAENEGLDSELHLTINGGIININSGNDGINTNEDGVSVTTVNGGEVNIVVNGSTGEGDGIDSNGWLVINGGKVTSSACGSSGDAGIDSDMGIYINGGTVVASGNMYDKIDSQEQNYSIFTFAQKQNGGETYEFKNSENETVFTVNPENDFMYLIISSDELSEGTYTLWNGEEQLSYIGNSVMGMGGFGGFGGGQRPDGGMQSAPIHLPNISKNDDGTYNFYDGSVLTPEELLAKIDEIIEQSENMGEFARPEGDKMQKPNGNIPENLQNNSETSTEFIIKNGQNSFSGVSNANK